MSNFKGTKGKWKLFTFSEGQMSVRNESDTRKICVPRVQNYEESLANLQLIACAPEMLDLLERLSHFEPLCDNEELNALIKKATEI